MKKIVAILLTLVLAFSMGTIAFATEGTDQNPTGTITIDNAIKDATYNIYKILDFEPVNGSANQGRYIVVNEWADFLAGGGADYLKANTDINTIEWHGEDTSKRKSDLAKAAVAYAKANNIAATATKKAEENGAVTFTEVPLGYYAIDTSLGTICALTNVDNVFDAHEKNEKPAIDKQVREDSEEKNQDRGWGKVNDADIDQKVEFKSQITVGHGVTNYVMHDTMEAGLTFDQQSVIVRLSDGAEVDAANYTVIFPATDGHTFDVKFDNDFIATLVKGETFSVYYSATVNENANIAVDGNDNTVYLSYGEDSTWETIEAKTTTYTWKMDVLKFTMDGSNKVSLADATFQLLTNDENIIKLSAVGGAVPTYKVDVEGAITSITTDNNGKFEIVGLDEGTYRLREIDAPSGYNKLTDDKIIVIQSTYDETECTASYTINSHTPATIEIENKTGAILPETGGIGTKVFYIVGGLLMVTAAVLLVSKKRMSNFI